MLRMKRQAVSLPHRSILGIASSGPSECSAAAVIPGYGAAGLQDFASDILLGGAALSWNQGRSVTLENHQGEASDCAAACVYRLIC